MSRNPVSTNIQGPQWRCSLPAQVLAWLLQSGKAETRLSPRRLLGEPAMPEYEDRHRLLSSGLLAGPEKSQPALTPAGSMVVSTLTAPLTHVTVRVWSTEKSAIETCVYFPGNMCGGSGVLLNEQPDGKRMLAGMIDAHALITLASGIIPAETEAWISGLSFEAHLHSAKAAVLCAVFDVGRTAYRRQGFPGTGLEPGTALSAGEIAGYLEAQWGMSDFDKLITYLPASAMRGEPPLRAEIDAAVAGLAAEGFLKESLTGRFVIGEPLRRLIPALFGMRSGLQYQRVSLLPGDETAVSHRIFLTGPCGAVLMFSPTVSDHVYMKLTSGDEIARFLADEAASILPLQSPPVTTPVTIDEMVTKCVACHAPVRKGARFCTNCGKEYLENRNAAGKTDLCNHCGNTLRPGAKFCTRCGHAASVP